MKNVEVTSWSQSQGWPIVRVTMSKMTVLQKANSKIPHRPIKANSRTSNARHFKWDCRRATSRSVMAIAIGACNPSRSQLPLSLHGCDQVLDFRGVRSEFTGKLVKIWIGKLLKAGFVDFIDDRDAHGFEFIGGLVLKSHCQGRLLHVDLIGSRLHPLLLF